jgi:hypothetical protein
LLFLLSKFQIYVALTYAPMIYLTKAEYDDTNHGEMDLERMEDMMEKVAIRCISDEIEKCFFLNPFIRALDCTSSQKRICAHFNIEQDYMREI